MNYIILYHKNLKLQSKKNDFELKGLAVIYDLRYALKKAIPDYCNECDMCDVCDGLNMRVILDLKKLIYDIYNIKTVLSFIGKSEILKHLHDEILIVDYNDKNNIL
ncbi:MAG: hypothetical protein ACTSRA_00490 [Promethearchaeota archaeon]|nr:MAG: hypothetical protein [Helarchaeota virus Nidhogg Meg22_1012]